MLLKHPNFCEQEIIREPFITTSKLFRAGNYRGDSSLKYPNYSQKDTLSGLADKINLVGN
jgi:hypothetical protein